MGYYCFISYGTFVSTLLMKKINLAITGCLGRMGQQIIKSVKDDKNFKLVAITESKKRNKKINGVKIDVNTEQTFKKAHSKDLKITEVEASEDPDTIQKHNINGFPTIVLFNNGKKSVHKGERTKNAFKQFVGLN